MFLPIIDFPPEYVGPLFGLVGVIFALNLDCWDVYYTFRLLDQFLHQFMQSLRPMLLYWWIDVHG